MNSASFNDSKSVSRINSLALALMNKAGSKQTSSGRNITTHGEALKLSLKRKPGEECSVTTGLSKTRLEVVTPENLITDRQSPQPSISGRASHSFEHHHPAGVYGQNTKYHDQQLSEAPIPIKKRRSARNHVCQWEGCGKQFSGSSHLADHKRVHTGDRPFPCKWPGCGKQFTQQSNRKTHERIHTGEKPFPCTWVGCGKRFKQKVSLTKHEYTHTGERPYKCARCQYAVSDQSSIHKHFKRHHPKDQDLSQKIVKNPFPFPPHNTPVQACIDPEITAKTVSCQETRKDGNVREAEMDKTMGRKPARWKTEQNPVLTTH